LLTDFVCLYTYEFWLSLCKIVRSSIILLLPLFVKHWFVQHNNFLVIKRLKSCWMFWYKTWLIFIDQFIHLQMVIEFWLSLCKVVRSSVILLLPLLIVGKQVNSLVEETGVPGENYRPVASEWQTISHNVLSTCDRCLQSNYFINDELTTGHPWNSSRGCKLEMHIWWYKKVCAFSFMTYIYIMMNVVMGIARNIYDTSALCYRD
jgi:hypothetical protein